MVDQLGKAVQDDLDLEQLALAIESQRRVKPSTEHEVSLRWTCDGTSYRVLMSGVLFSKQARVQWCLNSLLTLMRKSPR